MKLRVIYNDGEVARIVRPQTLSAGRVAFEVDGSSAVLTEGESPDLPEVIEQVEQLGCVQAVNTEVTP